MKKMSLRREIRIQKLQTKNKMTGQTFNPSGVTSEQLEKRNKDYLDYFYSLTAEDREKEIEKQKRSKAFTREMNISGDYRANLLCMRGII